MNRGTSMFALGSVVADRRLDSVAGEGGMGIVFRAWNLRLKRVEAIKVISEDFVRDTSFRDRFKRETEIVANINHPHVVTLYDSGEGPGGQLYIAMQYVEGTTLDRLCRQSKCLKPRLAAELIAQVGEALEAAHRQGLVHRDIKPANILVGGENEDEYHAYLTDFGLAKRLSSDSALTGIGLMIGTVDYMAPEQVNVSSVEPSADIYSLGATLYTALTGEVPFPRDSTVPKLLAKLSEPPPKATAIVDGLPPAFDAVIAKAMALAPNDRFASAAELGRAVLEAAGSSTRSGRNRRLRRGAPDPIIVGSVVDDRYQIEAEAGSGGMAVVYRAKHLKLAKTVALKVMNRTLADDPEFQRRFEEEARAASELDHESVIPVYDFGEDAHGLFLVMRYVDRNLRDLLSDRGPLEPVRAVQVVEQVASALDAAHARGLLHRDIKPANILVEESTSRIFLADFGLVRSSRDENRERTGSAVLGTDWYMAPERRYHEETKLGDIYSLGCVLWEMLAGLGKPRPGRSATPDQDANILPGLLAVVERAISERPRERFDSAGDFARAARAALVPPRGLAPTAVQEAPTEAPAFHDPLSAGLRRRVLDLCAEVSRDATTDTARSELSAISQRLQEPLVLAVAGREGAGKSTIVNALVGRMMQTDSGEHTRIVTWFRYGSPERVEFVLNEGARESRELTPDGRIPSSLGVSPEQLTAVEVWLTTDTLKSLTIVDTPGLPAGSPDEPTDAHNAEAAAIERADAMLFTMAGDATAQDQEALEAFRRRFDGSRHASAVNAIAVLTKADLLAADSTQWEPAVKRAEALRKVLGLLVSTVVPVASRIAETVNTGALSDEDLAGVQLWAKLDPARRERLLYSADGSVLDVEVAAAAERRERLLGLLGRYGVRLALELADSGDLFNQVVLIRRLRELSGIGELRRQIDAVQLRIDALKADTGLLELESISWRHQMPGLRNRIGSIRLDAPLLELMRLFDRCARGEIELDTGRLEELERLLTGRTMAERLGLEPAVSQHEIERAAVRQARAWRTWSVGGLSSFQGQQVANKVDDLYMQIAFPS